MGCAGRDQHVHTSFPITARVLLVFTTLKCQMIGYFRVFEVRFLRFEACLADCKRDAKTLRLDIK